MQNKYSKNTFAALKIIGDHGVVTLKKFLTFIDEAIDPCSIKRTDFKSHWRINYTTRRLRERGWIKLIRTKGIAYYSLTAKGKAELLRYEMKNIKIKQQKRWDNKWRIISFDVPERQRYSRDNIRTFFKNLGLVQLQMSVWIYPFPCEDIIELAKTNYHIRRGVIYFVCNRFNGDDKLAFNFGLGLNPNE